MKYLLSILYFLPLFACTDIVIETKDGALINGRSMEFGLPMNSKIALNPKGRKHQSKAPNNEPGLAWTSKYGYISINCLEQGFTTDGLNEEGLSIGALWFADVEYPQVAPGLTSQAIVLQDVGNWLLGNFATVEEVKNGLSTVIIWAEAIPPIGIPPLHLIVHDAKGNHLVMEFINGEMVLSDNPLGIFTNAPSFDWQLTNLRNYINLSPVNVAPLTIDNFTLHPTGQGTGLMGLPGDWSSPSRFIKAALSKAFAIPAATTAKGIILMEHLLNTVDIPLGVVRTTSNKMDFTQWIVIKDLTHKIVYYRTYDDLTLRFVDLKRLDFSPGHSVSSFLMQSTEKPIDVSSKLPLK